MIGLPILQAIDCLFNSNLLLGGEVYISTFEGFYKYLGDHNI